VKGILQKFKKIHYFSLKNVGYFMAHIHNDFSYTSGEHLFIYLYYYALQLLKAYCAIWVRRSNVRHQASPRVSPHESTQRRKVELWGEKYPVNFA